MYPVEKARSPLQGASLDVKVIAFAPEILVSHLRLSVQSCLTQPAR